MERSRRGFSLIELLAVLAILGVLAALLTPAVGSAVAKARRLRMANQLRQIAIAHASCRDDRAAALDLDRATNLAEWAAALAWHSGVNDAALYVVPEDFLIPAGLPLPRAVLASHGQRPADDFSQFPLAFTALIRLPANANPSTTPLAYGRGLDPATGFWKPSQGDDGGICGTDGGWIVFLDGHVQFFRSLDEDGGALIRHGDGAPTADIRETVPPGVRAINWKGVVWERTNGPG